MTHKWKKLRNGICDMQDTKLYDEAIKCLEVRAYRMAYIAVWICIAESLKHKFSIMARKDKSADEVVQTIEKLEQEHRPPDRFILDKAKDLGLLDEVAFHQAENIFEMRNLFAHPYHMAPRKEEVESAAAIAVDKILSIQPFLRKPYIDALLENLQSNRHFIDDLERRVIEFAKDTVTRVSPELHCYLVKGLFYRLDGVINDPDKRVFSNRLIWFAQTYIQHLHHDFSDAEWRLQDKFSDFPQAVSSVLAAPEVWPLVPGTIQDSIVSYLLYPEKDGKVVTPEHSAITLVFVLANSGQLSRRQHERLNDVLAKFGPDELVEIGVPIARCIDDIKGRFVSYNFYIQNPAADAIKTAGPEGIRSLTNEDKECLGRNVLQSAEGGARSSCSLIQGAVRKSERWPYPFVRGLLLECFVNEQNVLRCKNKFVKEALLIAIRKCERDGRGLLSTLIRAVKRSKPKEGVTRAEIDESVNAIDECRFTLQGEQKKTFRIALEALKSAVLLKRESIPAGN